MLDNKDLISRRKFLGKGLIGLGGISIMPLFKNSKLSLDEFLDAEYLGRNTVYLPSSLALRDKPSVEGNVIRTLDQDECVIWNREVIGERPTGRSSRKWVETSEGYVYSPSLQKVKNLPNQPVTILTATNEEGNPGMWVEVTVPYVNLTLVNAQPLAPWLIESSQDLWRLYYSQVIWVDQIAADENGNIMYRINERYGTYGDIFWVDARAFRIITPEELTPINPDATDKKIIVNINQQNLICYEGNTEVFYCQVATGRQLDDFGNPTDDWATPVGTHWIWRKLYSLHMAGGGTGHDDISTGWDTMAIPWNCLFVGDGVAIHGAFWHNDFGTPKSHGCVNTLPEDAKWILRWTTPSLSYNTGDISDTINYSGTKIEVIKPLY